MGKGIAILGLNGSGKSTLTHVLAKKLNFYEMDAEDYYFPEQKSSRLMALDNQYVKCNYIGELPYSEPRKKDEVQQQILYDIKEHSNFILAGVTMNWCDEIISRFSLAFLIRTPTKERVRRVQQREEVRFGARVLEGGDMFEQQFAFRNVIARREEKTVNESALKLKCPVIELDGINTITENVDIVIEYINSVTNFNLFS